MKIHLSKIFLIINFICLICGGCKDSNDITSAYLDGKNCSYHLSYSGDSLMLDYCIIFDTSSFKLANIDTSRVSLYQSAYFAWHANYISYRILDEYEDFENITLFWKIDTILDRTIFSITNNRKKLLNKFSDSLHYSFVSYLIDSIPIDDYFTLNNILYELYEIYGDPRLTWNYAHLINQFERNQCGKKYEHVSFEVFMLLDIGIRLSNLDKYKQKDLLRYNGFFLDHCLPDRDLLNEDFDKLNLNQ